MARLCSTFVSSCLCVQFISENWVIHNEYYSQVVLCIKDLRIREFGFCKQKHSVLINSSKESWTINENSLIHDLHRKKVVCDATKMTMNDHKLFINEYYFRKWFFVSRIWELENLVFASKKNLFSSIHQKRHERETKIL